MGKVINLRIAKKRIDRAQKEKTAQENRVNFGRTKLEKSLTEKDQKKSSKSHEGKKLTKACKLDDLPYNLDQ